LAERRPELEPQRADRRAAFPPPPGGPRARPGDARGGPLGSFAPPTALYNADDEFIAGSQLTSDLALLISVPVMIDGVRIGELRSEPRRQIESPMATAFSKRQLVTSWVIGLTSLSLALLISLALSKGLLAPVNRMIHGVGRLSQGDYAFRMQEQRRDELGALTRDLDHLAMTLEEAQLARRRLLADVSHELRTPLTVLTGEIEALKDGLRDFNKAQLASLDQEVQRLRFLVNDLYEFSLSDAGGLSYKFAPINFNESVHRAIANMSSRAAEAGLTLRISSSQELVAPVMGDSDRLVQLMSNLLENALAYTDAPGNIDITVSQSDATITLRIDDSPPGASIEECEQFFEPLFRQDSSRARRSGGAGLGLAICRNIAIAHGGSASAKPSPLGGITMVVELPAIEEHRL
ncbi:MAG: ATP-binding protein, partial [Congregibacter sp.]|nr:ATP-binding protein [Congregibacter sp.]